MILTDYLIVARGGRLFSRAGFLAYQFSADQLTQMRRLARRERLSPSDTQESMSAAGIFWSIVCVASMVTTVVLVLALGALIGPHRFTWAIFGPLALGGGVFIWSAALVTYAVVRSRNLYDAVIAQRAGRWGNRVLSGMALPKPRDFWIATALGAFTVAFMLYALFSS